ncbi:MAG: CPBP family glutamic-type intramembrane protease [Actinomycetota bacterium]
MIEHACSNCGHPLQAEARFCTYCGADVTQPGSTYSPQTPEVLDGSAPVDPDEQPVGWRAIEGIGIFIIAVILTVIFTIPFAISLRPASNCGALGAGEAACLHHRDLLLAYSIGLNELALLVTVLFWVRFIHKSKPRALGFRRFTAKNGFIGIGVGLGGLVVAGIISTALTSIVERFTNKPVEAPQQIPLQQSPGSLVLAIVGVSVIVLAPLAEEAFFRGFVFRGLRRWLRPGWAIVLSATVFGLAHLIPLIMLPIFGLGILLASIVEARGSLVPSIFAHATFNAVGFIQLFIHR